MGCSGNPERELAEEFSTELPITAAAAAPVTRALPAGVYLVEVREQEIDVRVSIDAEELHVELLDRVPRHGALQEVVRLRDAGELRIAVSSADHPTKLGSARIRIARWERAVDSPPSDLELGYRALGEAGQQTALATPASWTLAADKLYEAVGHFERAGAEATRAQAAYALAFIQYDSRDDWNAAGRAARIAIDAYQSVDDEVGRQSAVMLHAAADAELAAGMIADTQRAQQKTLNASVDRRLADTAAFFASRGMLLRAVYATNLRVGRAVNGGDYELAEKLLSDALIMARSSKDVASEAIILGNLAAVHIYVGKITQAAREYEALASMIDRKSRPYNYATWLANYGFTMIALGNFDRALELHLESLEVYTAIGKEEERAVELAALGGLYFRMGDASRALETLRAAIAAQKSLADTIGLASTLRVAGNAAAALGNSDLALEYLRESARIDSNPHGVARTRVLIAGQLRGQRKFAEALAELEEPLTSGNAVVRGHALEERARINLASGQQEAVVDDLRAADRAYASVGLEYDRIDANSELSQVLLARGDVQGAKAAADEAVAIVSRMRVNSANPEWRARFLSARYGPFEARIAVELAGARQGDDTAEWNAFRLAEQVRARSLADEMAFDMSSGSRVVESEETELRERLSSQQLRLDARVQRQDPDEAGTLALRRAIAETRAQLDSSELRRGGVKARERALEETLAQVRAKLPEDTAVLAYFAGDARSYAWLLSRKVLRHAEIDAVKSLAQSIGSATRNGRFDLGDAAASRKLGEKLLGHLLDGVNERRLLIVADGPLHSVPFAALPVADGGQLLIDRFVVGYAPSLALVLENTPVSRSKNSRVAIISDPIYAADDRRLTLAAADTSGRMRSPPAPSPNRLTRLPYSAMEASAVIRALSATDAIHLAGFDATSANVMRLGSQDLAVLHFATHADVRSNLSGQSELFLTEYRQDGSLLPASTLAANEIRRSGLHADVVVLSGCATGDGSELRGEGILGLTYGFLANGSRSVVASLWPIEDASTARFMSEFYKAYRESGRAADALRAAQMRFRASSKSTVWSSFVVRANDFP